MGLGEVCQRYCMRLCNIYEGRWIEVTGGANSLVPGYSYPWSHPHVIHDNVRVWYHGTSDIYIDSIKSVGLNNLLASNDTRTRRGDDSVQHLTGELKLAKGIARNKAARVGGRPVIVIVDGSKLPSDMYGTITDSMVDSVPVGAIVDIKYF